MNGRPRMDDVAGPPLSYADLSTRQDFRLGSVVVSPSSRIVRAVTGVVTLEPRVMQVLTLLAEADGSLVTRQTLFRRCWGTVAVGEDSLNRVIAVLRRVAEQTGPGGFKIRTVPAAGYVLEIDRPEATAEAAGPPVDVDAAIRAGFDSWRLALPAPDWPRIEGLRKAVAANPQRADAWAMLALLLRIAAEYAEADACAEAVDECQACAAKALALDGSQTNARAALASLAPLFGDWTAARRRLTAIRHADPANVAAAHDLAVLEMATGRLSAAAPIIAALIEADPLGAIFHYKRMYHLWSLGQLGEMDRVADRAMQLWPRHPAIWHSRLWSLAFTGRAEAAVAQVEDASLRPDIPPPALAMLHATMTAVAELRAGDEPPAGVVAQNLAAAARGPAQCVAAIIHLGGLGALDAAFDVANGYLARRGPLVTPLRHTAADPSINDQHRRVTQMLFIPATAGLRADPRFADLCEAIGLGDYWRQAKVTPDFLSAG
jgi:DNA-binding winged helix-turn-helix (wHTH) protein